MNASLWCDVDVWQIIDELDIVVIDYLRPCNPCNRLLTNGQQFYNHYSLCHMTQFWFIIVLLLCCSSFLCDGHILFHSVLQWRIHGQLPFAEDILKGVLKLQSIQQNFFGWIRICEILMQTILDFELNFWELGNGKVQMVVTLWRSVLMIDKTVLTW